MKYAPVLVFGALALPLVIVACGGNDAADELFSQQAGGSGEPGGSGGADASAGGTSQGGKSQGGSSNGGSSNGGASNGGASNGGASNGGASNGGASNGGSSNGGASNGGSSNGGSANGGSANGGSSNGGSANGGSANGGSANGGSSTGGASTGGSSTGGAAGCPLIHDEDGDQVDDACDNCPAILNGGQSNTDGDGVGNLCEHPKDQNRLAHIEYFEPFLAKPGAFQFGSHTSMGADEVLIQTEDCGFGCSDMAFWNQVLDGTYAVETSFTYESGSFGYVGAAFARKQDTWWACLLNRVGGGTGRYLALWYYPGWGTVQKMAEASGAEDANRPAGTKRRITVHVSPSEALCSFGNEAGDSAQVWAAPPQGGNFNGLAGMRVYEANARYQSFVVYSP